MRILLGTATLAVVLSACVQGHFEVKGATLREIIENTQRSQVRPSYGELAHECYTWGDLARFEREKTADRIARDLRANRIFLAAVEKLRRMNADERQTYLKSCRRPLRPTFAEIGEISPRATTTAGQRCERILAERITALAVELLREPGPAL